MGEPSLRASVQNGETTSKQMAILFDSSKANCEVGEKSSNI